MQIIVRQRHMVERPGAVRPHAHKTAGVAERGHGGRTLLRVVGRNGHMVRRLDVRGVPGPVIEVRFVTEGAAPPPASPDGRVDPRVLGVFVHRVELLPDRLPTDLELASADDDGPELGPGWREAETWPDGRRGRWTGAGRTSRGSSW